MGKWVGGWVDGWVGPDLPLTGGWVGGWVGGTACLIAYSAYCPVLTTPLICCAGCCCCCVIWLCVRLCVVYINVCVFRFVEWEDFADHAMVQNPKGGTAVQPKLITEVVKPSADVRGRVELHKRHK